MATSTSTKFKKAMSLRRSGLTVAEACKKADLPVPTFYYQMKRSGSAIRRFRVSTKETTAVTTPSLSGYERRKLKTAATRIQRLASDLEKILSRV